MERVHLTREGYEKLTEELEQLKNVKRKEISKAIGHARSLGDLKENAEYAAAKEAMSLNEKRINELEDKLSRTEIIDDLKMDADKAYLGAKVTLQDLDTGDEIEYMLVSTEEADPMQDMISATSPVGKALLGHEVDDIIEIEVPAGKLKYKIIKITR
jgi:transcription elongation factor GreA